MTHTRPIHGGYPQAPAAAAEAESAMLLRGRLDVAVDLLRECIGPLEVSAAVIESDDAERMEELVDRVRRFVDAAVASRMPARPAASLGRTVRSLLPFRSWR